MMWIEKPEGLKDVQISTFSIPAPRVLWWLLPLRCGEQWHPSFVQHVVDQLFRTFCCVSALVASIRGEAKAQATPSRRH